MSDSGLTTWVYTNLKNQKCVGKFLKLDSMCGENGLSSMAEWFPRTKLISNELLSFSIISTVTNLISFFFFSCPVEVCHLLVQSQVLRIILEKMILLSQICACTLSNFDLSIYDGKKNWATFWWQFSLWGQRSESWVSHVASEYPDNR